MSRTAPSLRRHRSIVGAAHGESWFCWDFITEAVLGADKLADHGADDAKRHGRLAALRGTTGTGSAERSPNRSARRTAQNRASIHREADRVSHHFRGPGGYRDRKRATVRSQAAAHARA